MATTMQTAPSEHAAQPRALGWVLMLIGIGAVSWWVSVWAKVDELITAHVTTHGALPASSNERAGLYANGTGPEQALSSDLAEMSGLYPWGRLPLLLGVAAFVFGWIVAIPTTRARTVVAGVASVLLLAVPILAFGESARIALDILE